jgi:hypothetical protein
VFAVVLQTLVGTLNCIAVVAGIFPVVVFDGVVAVPAPVAVVAVYCVAVAVVTLLYLMMVKGRMNSACTPMYVCACV